MIINILLIIFWLILIPIILGKVLVKENENTLMYSWTIGHIFQMAIFFVISIIFVLCKISFHILWKLYSGILLILFFVFLIIFRKNIFKKANIKNITTGSKVFKILAIILVLIQLVVKIKYTNVNNDDYTFVVMSQQMIETGKMYYSDELPNLFARRALAPISAYYSAIAKQVNIDVTILTHSIMPLFFLIMSYNVYFSFSRRIFKNDENSYIMLIFLSVLNLYTINVKGISKYMLLYTWFGRAFLGSTTLPLAWKLSLEAMSKESKVREWALLLVCVLASCLTSQMAVPLISISLGVVGLISAISDKKISYLFKTILCVIPCLIVGVIYLIIK